jgi:hypothetical protein
MTQNPILCYNCQSEIFENDATCKECSARILFGMIDQSTVEFMTEGTNPNMTPRSDNG